jgi:protocatechuate 3,4-dioxygenase beta subunit
MLLLNIFEEFGMNFANSLF